MTKKYKCVSVSICEVDNGWEASITASFNHSIVLADMRHVQFKYVAKTEQAIIDVVSKAIKNIKQ